MDNEGIAQLMAKIWDLSDSSAGRIVGVADALYVEVEKLIDVGFQGVKRVSEQGEVIGKLSFLDPYVLNSLSDVTVSEGLREKNTHEAIAKVFISETEYLDAETKMELEAVEDDAGAVNPLSAFSSMLGDKGEMFEALGEMGAQDQRNIAKKKIRKLKNEARVYYSVRVTVEALERASEGSLSSICEKKDSIVKLASEPEIKAFKREVLIETVQCASNKFNAKLTGKSGERSSLEADF